jgi:TonB family protein
MIELILRNLLAYSVQIAILIGIAALLSAVLKMTPAARLYSFQALLACCLAIPFLQPWRLPDAKSAVTTSTLILSTERPAKDSTAAWRPSPPEVALAVIAAGMLVRIGFILLGFWRLRRYLDRARFLPTAFPVEKERTGAWPDVFVSEELKGPVTFGLWNPVVLIPARWIHNPTIAFHELLHVRRRDWAFTVLEEIVRAALWFHPAVWWLIGQIQLAREEVVDRGAVQLMHSREQYIDTLLAIAEAKAGVDLAPATLFLKKRHLRQRVAALLKEVSMSQFRMISSLAGFASVLTLAGWMATRSFPLQAAPQSVKDAAGVKVQQDETKLLHRSPVRYPQSAIEKGIQGTVVVEASLDSKGEVSDAQVISGPQELRKAALESVLQWHYNLEAGVPPKVQVAIDFVLPSQNAHAPNTLPVPPANGIVQRINLGSLPAPLREKVEARLPIHIGDELTAANSQELTASLSAIDEHLHATWTPSADNSGSVINVFLNTGSADSLAPKRIKVGGNVQAMNIISKVTPVYPPLAKQAKIQGTVRFTAYIAKDGHIESLELVSGHPLLAAAAQNAVKQWVYRPTLLNGDPVEVVTQIDVNYTLLE